MTRTTEPGHAQSACPCGEPGPRRAGFALAVPPWTGTRYVWNPHGAFGSRVDGNLSLAEGTGISYMACLGEYGSRTVLWNTCSSPVADRA